MHERKATKISILIRNSSRATHVLGVVHSDVCGSFEVHSLGGSKYFVSFVDEFIRKTWVALIKFKCEVFDEFMNFKVKVENQSG